MSVSLHDDAARTLLIIDNTAILTNDEVKLNVALTAASTHLRFIELLEYEESSILDGEPKTHDTLVLWYDDHNITMDDVRNLSDFLFKYDCQLDLENFKLVTDHQAFADATASYAPLFPLNNNRELDLVSTNIPNIEAFVAQFGEFTAYNRHSLQHAVIITDDGHLHRNSAAIELFPGSPAEQIFTPMGWQIVDAGTTRKTDYNDDCVLYKRRRQLKEVLSQAKNADFSAQSEMQHENNEHFGSKKSKKIPNNGYFTMLQAKKKAGSNTAMGEPRVEFDPDPVAEISLSRLSQFGSLRALQGNSNNLIIGFDSEWVGDASRKMLSWQFAVIDGNDLVEYVFIKRAVSIGDRDTDLCMETALGRILDDLGASKLRRRDAYWYQCIVGYDKKQNRATFAQYEKRCDAEANAAYCYIDGEPSDVGSDAIEYDFDKAHRYSLVKRLRRWDSKDNIAVTLVAHSVKADISGFNQSDANARDVMRYLTEAQGGLFTTQPVVLEVGSLSRKSAGMCIYPVSLSVRDSMCSAPGDAKTLAALGETIGIPKVEIPAQFSKDKMDTFMELDLPSYLEYASTDAVIAMLYTSSIYGINKEQPPTLLSSGTRIIRDIIAGEYGVKTPKEFNAVYRGIQPVVKGKKKCSGKQGFYEEQDYEPINDDARLLQDIAPLAYHGGYNGCSEVGFYDIETYDYDLQNAYPTAMCLVPDIDWENCILDEYKSGHILTLDDFTDIDGKLNICTPILANVSFKFPKGIKYPCLPMNVEGIPVFLQSSEGTSGVYTCGPELYLALRLGAEIVVNRGFKARARLASDGNIRYSLRAAVKQLVSDRRDAKNICGKGSLEELVLKLFVNGAYGKVAQSVKQRSRWSAYRNEMEEIGVSPITNAVSAAMITSIIRAVLLAAQNQIDAVGHKVYSVTTDGFISDIPEAELKQLDLYGFRETLGIARLFLTDGNDTEIWEMKHMQNDLLNFTTRGNVSLNTGMPLKALGRNVQKGIWNPIFALPGVCAHNSAKSGFPSDSYEDRLWLMTQVLLRNGPITCQHRSMTPFKDMVQKGAPFRMHEEQVSIRMDFDMKRKPVQASFQTVQPVVAGIECAICNFTTEPYSNVSEYHKFRSIKENVVCLRSADDWKQFFGKLQYYKTGAKPRDLEFDKIKSLVTGARIGMWDIPYLTSDAVSVADKIDFVNQFIAEIGMDCKPYYESDWKNSRRPNRVSKVLPQEYLADLIVLMQEKSAKMLADV